MAERLAARFGTRDTDQTAKPAYAIVGMATRLPGGGESPRAFWEYLQKGGQQLGSLSTSRFEWPDFIDKDGAHNGIDRACLISNVAAQDMAFFGISPKEAELMDPQQRILLELSWETLESAGHKPSALGGSTTGVFIGVCHSDYRELMAARARSAEAYVGTGNIPCMLANRVSYYYNFKGPSFTVDTACSSSLFAVAEAVNAIARGECEQALVGAINLILTPTSSIAYYQAGMLSSSESCNPFDDDSDGYLRAEGAGMILIKSLHLAQRDGDHIFGLVSGVAINHGGKARSLTAPSALAQSQVIAAAFERAGVPVDSVNYVETHGTGTPIGDPIEIHGLSRSFTRLAKQQSLQLPVGYCALGALKASVGHSEAAAGMAAIVKVLLAMHYRQLPPNHRLQTTNRRIELDDSPFYLIRQGGEWTPTTSHDGTLRPLRAGISSFGFGGTNAHLLLEAAAPMPPTETLTRASPQLFGLSARSDAALIEYARRYLDWLSQEPAVRFRLADLCHSVLNGREPLSRRLAIVAGSVEQLIAGLKAFVAGEANPAVHSSLSAGTPPPDSSPDALIATRDLPAVAQLWAGGIEVDFRLLSDESCRKLPLLPTYPFERKSYWVPWSKYSAHQGGRQIHPLLHENISNFSQQAYRSVFEPDHAMLTGHRVADCALLPGVAYLIMVQYALADALGLGAAGACAGLLTLREVRWLQPMAAEGKPLALELRLRRTSPQAFGFEFVDRHGGQICEGRAQLAATAAAAPTLAALPEAGFDQLSAEQCYASYRAMGLDYGPDYRVIQAINRSADSLTAYLALPAATPEPLPVALLDGALQSCIVAVRGGAEAVAAALALPASVESVQVFAPCESRMRAVIRLPQGGTGGDAQPFDIDLGNEQGRVCVRFIGVRVVRLDADVFVQRIRARAAVAETLPSDDQADTASVGEAVSLTAPAQGGVGPVTVEAARAGLVQLVAALLRMTESDIDIRRKFTDYGVDSILAVSFVRQINARWNCKLAPTVTFDCPTIEALALRVASLPGAARPQPAAPVDATTAVAGISAAGFAVALKSTIAQLLKVDVASIDEHAKFTDYGVDSIVAGSLTREINRRWALSLKPTAFFDFPSIRALAAHVVTATPEPIRTATLAAAVAEAGKAVDIPAERFVDAAWAPPSGHGYKAVVLHQPSQIGELTLSARTEPVLGDEDVVISVRAFSLNFGDLLCASGFYPSMPDYPFTPGFEAAGVVTAVGRRVEEFMPGDAVVALSGRELGAHANRLQCHRERIFHKPADLSFEEAVALPVVGLTVLDAFAKARPRAGERILIQTASGGVGLAAVQLAQHLGAEIYATAGSEEKLHYLRGLGIRHLINYRDCDFEQQIHRMTDGRGVDVVLNTLPGDALQKGLNCLSPGGRYVEIAMTALKSATRVDLSVLGDNQSFFSVNLFKLGLDQPLRLREHIARLLELQRQGVLRPVVDQVFPLEQYRAACRYLADRRSIGKVVVRIGPELHYQPGTAARAIPSVQASDRDTDVAIIGVSGRFAGSDTVEELWQHLAEGRDLVTAVTRWDLAGHYAGTGKSYCDRGSFLGDIESFDPLFFGISGVEARHMDPQQRLLLEEAWHALEDAGHASDRIRGKSCGVFVGCTEGDYHYRFGKERIPPQAFWGNALSLVPARIAYHLDLHGPAVAVDTACSSSLVAVHQACQSLWLGEIDLAIAGGVFVQSTAKLYLSTERAEMLSHRGHCHAFGDLADGFVPGEGVGVIVLKRLALARADGDRIHGVIRGSGIAQDGATNGITAPSPSSQYRLQRDVYRRFGIDPAQIQLVEAHGTGTSLGDPIEFEALSRSFREYTNERQYCALGSIKSSIGHLAPAAGIAGLIKVLLALRNGQIPPSLHCGRSNPQLDLANSPFYLSRSLHPWPQPATGRRMAAVSSFGFSGTNAHLVVAQDTASALPSSPRPAYLIVISAQSLPQLTTLVQRIARQTRGERPDCGHLSHTLLTGRKHFGSRFACVVRDIGELADRLDGWLAGEISAQTWSGECVEGAAPSEPRISAARRCVAQCIAETDAQNYESQLALLAAAFVEGVDVDYAPLSADGTFRIVSLPTYPFARQRFWVAMPAHGSAFAHDLPDGKRHPLVHREVSGAGGLRYCSYFSGKERFFSDHQVLGQAQLSAAAQLEMAAAAVALSQQGGRHAVQFSDVNWPAPMSAVGPLDVVIALDHVADAGLRFEIRSGQGDRSVVHARGSASWGATAAADDAAPDIAGVRADARLRRFSAASFYDAWRRSGIDHGVSHRGVEEIWVEPGGERLWAALALPAGEDDFDQYVLHPGLLDAALQAAGGFSLADAQAPVDPVPLLPFSLRRLRWYRAPPRALLVCVHRIVNADGAVFDLAVHDRQGQVCLRLEGLQTRAALVRAEGHSAPSAASGADGELWLRPYWNVLRPAPLAAGSAASLKKTLAVGLDAVQEVELRQVYPVRAAVGIEVGDSADSLQRKLAGCVDIEHVLLVFTRARPDDALDDGLIANQYEAVRFLLHLVQALLGLGYGARALSFTLVTRRAQALHAADPIAVTASSLHGMAGSLAKEQPGWQIRLLDTDAADAALWRSLPDLPFDAMGNTLLHRDGLWHAQQLQPCRVPAATARPFRQGGVYVIVGGAGGIGVALSEYLVRHYQARMVWIGRRDPDEHIERRLDNLERLGPRPLYLVADAASETALAAAFAQVRQTFGAVHGVVHSAIVLRDMSLEALSEEALAKVLRAKVEVSVRIAQVLAHERLDFVLFFSSANAFLRAPGQSNYVAGCVFKDALAQRLAQTADYPVKVINWGYWGSTGLVANPAVRTRMAAQGLASIEPQQAMQALEQLLAGPFRQLVYLSVNRPLRALGAPLCADDHARVAPEAGDPVAAERALAAVRDSFAETRQVPTDDSRSQIERQLLPLLWFQLRQSGLLQPQAAQLRRYAVVPSRHDRWLAESLRWLERAELLEVEDGAIVAADALDDKVPDWLSWSALVQRLGQDGDSRYWLTLADETLRALPDILTERQAATEVLFPDASLQLVEGIYKHDRVARLFNEALAGAVAAYVRQRRCDGGTVRVLELGAGTGSSSEPVFARLRAERLSVEEYCYTDISRAFLLHAEQRYGTDNDYLSYDLIDIERPANTAPRHYGRYDLVIAANVLHATRNIAATVQHAKSLLRRGGLLLINEISATTPMMHLTFGLLDGWWLAQDLPLRMPGGPALAPSSWQRVLDGAGFSAVVLPLAPLHALGYQLIVAQSDGVIVCPGEVDPDTAAPPGDENATGINAAVAAPLPVAAASEVPAGSAELRARAAAWAAGEKAAATIGLSAYLCEQASAILDLERSVLDTPLKPFDEVVLGNFGMDSLLSSNLRNRLLKDLEVDIAVQVLIGEKIAHVVEQIYQQLLLQRISRVQEQKVEDDFETFVF